MSTTTLEFGVVPVGEAVERTVLATSRVRVPVALGLEVEAPFSVGAPALEVAAGSTDTVVVRFRPTREGLAQGQLVLTGSGGVLRVDLSGTGGPPCASENPCEQPAFDAQAGRCGVLPMADGAPCRASCVAEGQCSAGQCIGRAMTCDDGNACTADACAATGCVHPELTCAVVDRCLAAYCEPDAGCLTREVADGTPCGPSSCAQAAICLSGRCQVRARPNAEDDCHYVELITGGSHFCARTRGGGVRCWGNNQAGQLGLGYASDWAPPGFLGSSSSGIASVAANVFATCVAGSSGQTQCHGYVGGGGVAGVAGYAVAGPGLQMDPDQLCGAGTGEVLCQSVFLPDSGLAPLAQASPSESWCVGDAVACAVADGGVWCGGAPVSGLPAPASEVRCGEGTGASTFVPNAPQGDACARLTDGSVWCWGKPLRPVPADGLPYLAWDAGVAAFELAHGAGYFASCAEGPVGTQCVWPWPNGARSESVPWSQVVQFALGDHAACALLDGGRVSCRGFNSEGALGDRSIGSPSSLLLPMEGTFVRAVGDATVVGTRDGTIVVLGRTLTEDAGQQWAEPRPEVFFDGGALQVGGGAGTGICVLDAQGELRCERLPLLTRVARFGASGRQVCTLSPAQSPALRCWDSLVGSAYSVFAADAGVPAFLSDAAQVQTLVPAYPGACAVRADHSVWCSDGAPALLQQATTLGPVVDLCAGRGWACALLVGGGLRCWAEQAGWLPTSPAPVPGAWSQVRGVSCGQSHACFWSGTNGVQCIGDNGAGQLGRDGPSSSSAVAIPMEERVEEVSAGLRHSCARLSSGRIRCWGDNHHAQLGVPALLRSDLPVVVVE